MKGVRVRERRVGSTGAMLIAPRVGELPRSPGIEHDREEDNAEGTSKFRYGQLYRSIVSRLRRVGTGTAGVRRAGGTGRGGGRATSRTRGYLAEENPVSSVDRRGVVL